MNKTSRNIGESVLGVFASSYRCKHTLPVINRVKGIIHWFTSKTAYVYIVPKVVS